MIRLHHLRIGRSLFTLWQLEELGAHNNMVRPWVVTPWGRAPWLNEGEDVASLDTKKLAMERFANKVIHRRT